MSKPLHVLIVEDSESDAAMVVHLLRKAGYDVHDQRVESADQMQAALERQTWDLVISDYHLPQFNGPAALALIQEACLDIPFIVVSGIIDEETAIAMMRAGANDYLMKGKLTHLAAAVERELRDAKVRWGRKQAEEALRQSEERFRTLVENIPGEVYRCLPTPPWRIIHNSAKIETITGYPVSDFLEGSLFYSDFILPEDLEMVNSAMEAGIACKEPFIIEYRLRHADGSIRWVSEMGRAVYTEQGEPLWLDGVIMDITARKQAEEALRESEMRFRTLIENIPASVYRCEPTSPFPYIYNSDGIETICGYSAKYFIEKSMVFNDLELPEDLEMVTRALETAVAGKQPYSIEFRIRHADGSIRWVSEMGRAAYSEQGKPLWLDGVIMDITARKQAEEAKLLLGAAVEQTIEGIAVADMDGVIQIANSAWAQMHGYMLDEVLGKNLSIFHTPCQLQEEVLPFNEQVVKTGFNQGEVGHVRKDGTVFPTQMGTALLRNEAGYPVGFVGIAMDITEPKLAEEFLRLQSGALEAAANSIIITDRDGTIQWANRAFTQLTGYTLEEAIGKNPRLLVKSGKYEPSFYKQLWETILSGQVWHGEIINRHKDNTLYTEEMSITPLFDHNGDISHFIAIKQDITQRKLNEHALREEKERYRSLYENVPVGLYRTTPDGRILMANPALVQILGYKTFEELVKRNLEENGYGHGYSRADFKLRIEREEQVRGFEAELKRKDGSVVFIRESGQVVRDVTGQALYYEGTIEDITEFRRSEIQNLRLVAAIEHAGETVIVSDQKGQIQYVNPAFGKMFGKAADEVVGKNINFFSNVDQNSKDWQTILKTPRSGQVWRGDIRIDHADGMTLDIEATISPVLGLDKEVSSFVYVMRDVTQERAAEMQRRQSQKLEAIGQLAAGIAHEINTPTQFIGNNLRFLQNGFQDLSRLIHQYQTICQCVKDGVIPEDVLQETRAMAKQIDLDFLVSEIPQAIDGSLKGIERVTKIVSAMKEFSHPGTREKEITDINHAIENTIIVSRNEWKYAAEMVTDLDPELPHIPCLVDEFNQVILNLINNAADAVREAQSTRQDDEKGYISISTKRAGSWVIVKVSDNGTGIPANIRERVFDPFFTTKEVGKGTGQGLPISYDVIVNKLGGKISFETEEGKGTTFIIHLPIEPIQEKESIGI